MLSLSVVRGPLKAHEEEQVLREFNRLTSSHIGINEFRRWVLDSPAGPACHALLTTEESRIVGHVCLISLITYWRGKPIVAARTEYFFVHEGFRAEKVRGFEDSFLSPAVLLLDQLYRRSLEQGWGPFVVSASEEIQPYHTLVGCHPVDFHLNECLFVLEPWKAARQTPNLTASRRAGLFALSIIQSAIWTVKRTTRCERPHINSTPVGRATRSPEADGLAMFEDEDSLLWRYPEGQYAQFVTSAEPDTYLITKNGSSEKYLRVCQWRLASTSLITDFAHSLIAKAQSEKMLGVRWAVYQNRSPAGELLSALRRLGFLCVPRVRRLLIYSENPEFLNPAAWQISDSLFSFDL